MVSGKTVYLRTPLGSAELNLRRSDLGAVVNSLLMLVNGRRDRDDLVSVALRLGAPAESIDMLERQGLIEVAPLPAGKALLRPVPPTPPGTAAQIDNERYVLLYKNLVTACKEQLGLKGFFFQLRIEKAANLQALEELIAPMSEAIAKAQGPEAANLFVQHQS
jgi:hypothetical protein